VIEYADADSLFSTPRHPYTRALLDAVPSAAHRARERVVATGDVPSPIAPPPGCHFHPRCAFAAPLCKTTAPVLEPVSPTQTVACHRWREIPLRDAPQAEAAESDTVLARRLRAFDIANRKKTAAALG
jgi:oligopeptide/dipeptide ABC transporter ATP-binding protein